MKVFSSFLLLLCFLCIRVSAQTIFQKEYSHSKSIHIENTVQTSDKGFVLAGRAGIGSFSDIYILKIDSIGNTHWSKTYDGLSSESGTYVTQNSTHGYAITGGLWNNLTNSTDIFLLKVDDTGKVLNSFVYGGVIAASNSYYLTSTPDNGYLILGSTTGVNIPYSAIYLIKTDSSGMLEWTRTYTNHELNNVGFRLTAAPMVTC